VALAETGPRADVRPGAVFSFHHVGEYLVEYVNPSITNALALPEMDNSETGLLFGHEKLGATGPVALFFGGLTRVKEPWQG
jgi:hypothetical protein